MQRATCVGHNTMPRSQTCWFGVAFEAPRLANWAAANDTYIRRRSKRWGLNPTKNPTPPRLMRRTRHVDGMTAWPEPRHVGNELAVTRAHWQHQHPRGTHNMHLARTHNRSCSTNDQYGQTTCRMAKRSTWLHGKCTMGPVAPGPVSLERSMFP